MLPYTTIMGALINIGSWKKNITTKITSEMSAWRQIVIREKNNEGYIKCEGSRCERGVKCRRENGPKSLTNNKIRDKIRFSALCFHCIYNKTLECIEMLERRTSNFT